MHVVVGIIFNKKGEVLIAERPVNKYKPGLWEFPGGKVEPQEEAFAALQRELREEIAIEVISAEPWIQVHYDYGDRKVFLDTWKVIEFQGEASGAEGQQIKWVSLDQLSQFEFPEGNKEILLSLGVR